METVTQINPVNATPDTRLHMIRRSEEILSSFTPEQQQEIRYKQQILSSLGYFIGRDFRIPIELNEPGAGWHWNFKDNEIRVDPKDLVEKPMDYLRFVISHEGGHRRMTRVDKVPPEIWTQPGFSFMTNALEDPRTNNFVADVYPGFRRQMTFAYDLVNKLEAENKAKAQATLGKTPRFMEAGFQYIKQWFRETKGEGVEIDPDLPDEIKTVVSATLDAARDSWLTYPSREEADQGEEPIQRYAEASYEINRDRIWPEFKKLVDQDIQDQELQQALQNAQGESEGQGLPQELQDKLSPDEQAELGKALNPAGQPDGEPRIIDIDSLSPSIKEKIKEYIDGLPEEKKKELMEKAREVLAEFEKELSEEFAGKLSTGDEESKTEDSASPSDILTKPLPDLSTTRADFREAVEKSLRGDENEYEKERRLLLPAIDELETDLRELFVARRASRWTSGYRSGRRIDIEKRIQEKALGVSPVESKSWQKRELPQEKDYATTLLIDLSGSMEGEKILEAFRGAIVKAEALNRLSIPLEILGFNDRLFVFKSFEAPMSREVQDRMSGMLDAVTEEGAAWNDDGWAVLQASNRLDLQPASERFLIVLSDGLPVESARHPREQYELGSIVTRIGSQSRNKLIGLGLGRGTQHVKDYYPNSVAGIKAKDLPNKLSDVLREAIMNPYSF